MTVMFTLCMGCHVIISPPFHHYIEAQAVAFLFFLLYTLLFVLFRFRTFAPVNGKPDN